MSPLLKSAVEAGINGLKRKENPGDLRPPDFFEEADTLRRKYAHLIHTNSDRIAIQPSASYGLKAAIDNIVPEKGQHALTISEEFPSGYFTLVKWAEKYGSEIKIVNEPDVEKGRGRIWNERILDSISDNTALVMISSIHWTDGTVFDLEAIGRRCNEVGAAFVVDGTQSVGVIEIYPEKWHISALVCACYKWLLGPYSTALSYYSNRYDDGIPIEDSWMTRGNAMDFSNLTEYDESYQPGAMRYSVGEFSSFIHSPMLIQGLNQIHEWGLEKITDYCKQLTVPLIEFLSSNGFWLEEDAFRSPHLFGFRLPAHIDKNILLKELREQNIYLSLRQESIRVSPHMYNLSSEIDLLIEILSGKLKA